MEHLHTPVFGGRLPLDEPARFQAIDESRHIRRITGERLGKPPHRQRPSRFDEVKDVALGGGEVDLAADRRQVFPLREEEPHEELPGSAGILVVRHGVIIVELMNS